MTVAWRKFLEDVRAEGPRGRREQRVVAVLAEPGVVEDDTLGERG